MLQTLGEVCERTGFLVHSYVLMPNHYHLLLETTEPNLVAGMKWFQGTYTQRFNARHRLKGHLFQGRYKAIPVSTDDHEYFRVVSDYIHLNPARAGLWAGDRRRLADYPWSSFVPFVCGRKLPVWLVRKRVFAALELADEGVSARARYRAYLERRAAEVAGGQLTDADEEEWRSVRRGWYIGDEAFGEQLQERIDLAVRGRRRDSYRAEGLRRHDERAAEEALQRACETLNVTVNSVYALRQNDPLKQAIAWWVKSRTVIPDRWICERLEMGNRVNVSRAVRAFRQASDATRRRLRARLYKCTD